MFGRVLWLAEEEAADGSEVTSVPDEAEVASLILQRQNIEKISPLFTFQESVLFCSGCNQQARGHTSPRPSQTHAWDWSGLVRHGRSEDPARVLD